MQFFCVKGSLKGCHGRQPWIRIGWPEGWWIRLWLCSARKNTRHPVAQRIWLLQYRIHLQDQSVTCHKMLSLFALVCDPRGVIEPVLLSEKKESCRKYPGITLSCLHLSHSGSSEKGISVILRNFAPASFGEVIKAEVHYFSDMSTVGYGQCSYLKLCNKKGNIHGALVISKSKWSSWKWPPLLGWQLTTAITSAKASVKVNWNIRMLMIFFDRFQSHNWICK